MQTLGNTFFPVPVCHQAGPLPGVKNLESFKEDIVQHGVSTIEPEV